MGAAQVAQANKFILIPRSYRKLFLCQAREKQGHYRLRRKRPLPPAASWPPPHPHSLAGRASKAGSRSMQRRQREASRAAGAGGPGLGGGWRSWAGEPAGLSVLAGEAAARAERRSGHRPGVLGGGEQAGARRRPAPAANGGVKGGARTARPVGLTPSGRIFFGAGRGRAGAGGRREVRAGWGLWWRSVCVGRDANSLGRIRRRCCTGARAGPALPITVLVADLRLVARYQCQWPVWGHWARPGPRPGPRRSARCAAQGPGPRTGPPPAARAAAPACQCPGLVLRQAPLWRRHNCLVNPNGEAWRNELYVRVARPAVHQQTDPQLLLIINYSLNF